MVQLNLYICSPTNKANECRFQIDDGDIPEES